MHAEQIGHGQPPVAATMADRLSEISVALGSAGGEHWMCPVEPGRPESGMIVIPAAELKLAVQEAQFAIVLRSRLDLMGLAMLALCVSFGVYAFWPWLLS